MKSNVCSIEGCDKSRVARGLCPMHWTRWRTHGDPSVGAQPVRGVCSIDGCENPHKARGWCRVHYSRWQKHGDPVVTTRVLQDKECRAAGCGRATLAHSLCQMHLVRMKKWGSLDLPEPPTVEERFWAKVDKNGPAAPRSWDGTPLPGRCWLWTGAGSECGSTHGKMVLPNGRRTGAHRFSYESLVGSIPDGLTIDHLCREPRCVNPDHLEPVTQAENNRRAREAVSVRVPKVG